MSEHHLRPAALAGQPADPLRRPLLLVADARWLARLLGCGVRNVRIWAAAGRLPAPVCGRVVWRLEEINRWLAAGAPVRATWTAVKAAGPKT